MYIFETYLDMRQHRALKLPSLPRPLEGLVSQDKFERSRGYSLDKRSDFRSVLFIFLKSSWPYLRFSLTLVIF